MSMASIARTTVDAATAKDNKHQQLKKTGIQILGLKTMPKSYTKDITIEELRDYKLQEM